MIGRRTLLLLGLLLTGGQAVGAQETTARKELRESQQRLEQIRRERAALQKEAEQLKSRVHTAAMALANVNRQRAASARALKELDFQTTTLAASIDSITLELDSTRARLRQRTVLLEERLRIIYKRGPLHAARVVLSAEDFGDLLTRYKYLYQIALHDRALQRTVEGTAASLEIQEAELKMQAATLEALREEKAAELEHIRRLESRQAGTVRGMRQQEQRTQERLKQLARDEARIAGAIAELERKRREAESRDRASGRTTPSGSLTTRDMGNLPWPVDGRIVYRFGVERRPNGTVLRNNGIGIAAAAGTAVRAVEAGRVDLARGFEGYGPTVILSHGGGYYTLYHHLGAVRVREGQMVESGQTIGTVGGERTELGAHIEFRVQAPVRGGLPEPVDPIPWLRGRSGR